MRTGSKRVDDIRTDVRSRARSIVQTGHPRGHRMQDGKYSVRAEHNSFNDINKLFHRPPRVLTKVAFNQLVEDVVKWQRVGTNIHKDITLRATPAR